MSGALSDDLLERDLQARCVAWWNQSGLPGLLFHVRNEGKRNRLEAASLRALGVLAGVSDFVLLMEGGRVAFIELKTPTGEMSAEQLLFAVDCTNLGHRHYTVTTLPGFIDVTCELVAEAGRSLLEIGAGLPLP